MREIDIKETKEIGLSTLVFFADFCKRNNLCYFLGYGTLLGAIRHGGFIPWDDDIDLCMPRTDYDRLLLMKEELFETPYELVSPETNPQFEFPFAKICRKDTLILPSRFVNGYVYGCSIDIFPLDAISYEEDELFVSDTYKKIRENNLRILNQYHNYTGGQLLKGLKGFSKKCVYRATSFIKGPMSKRMLDYSRLFAQNPINEKTTYLATISGEAIFRKNWFDESIEMAFEGNIFNAPAQYDSILRQQYGDYMKFPPESERVIPHCFQAFYK